MADRLDVSLPAYSKMERNITDVGYKRLLQISKILGVTIIELLSDPTKKSEQTNLKEIIAEKDREINSLQKKIIKLLEGN